MYKRLLFFIIAVCSLAFAFFYLVQSFTSSLSTETPCAFCNYKILNRQKFYEDDLVIALYTHKPIVPSHFLILPKRHVERLEKISPEEMSRIHQVMVKIQQASQQVFQTSPYLIHQKNGREVGQSVPHVHFHLIAKSPGDTSLAKFIINLLLAHLKNPIPLKEMQNITEKMKMAMETLPSTSSNSQNVFPKK